MGFVLELKKDEMVALRAFSKMYFGQEQRLPLMVAIASHSEDFTLTDLKTDLSLEYPSTLQSPLNVLAEAGLILKKGPVRGSRFRYYGRVDGSAWKPWLVDTLERVLKRPISEAELFGEASVTDLAERRER